MPEKPSFVVNDRRKFTSEGELREGTHLEAASPSPHVSDLPVPANASESQGDTTAPQTLSSEAEFSSQQDPLSEPIPVSEEEMGLAEDVPEMDSAPGPTTEQSAEAMRAYNATVERLDTAMRATNPGGEHMPQMTFERLIQSLYTQALLLLGGVAEPGETPRVDILGSRQTIDMISVLSEKTKGNLSDSESNLLESALFDLRMGFLELTQALARQAAQRQGAPSAGAIPMGGPRIVR